MADQRLAPITDRGFVLQEDGVSYRVDFLTPAIARVRRFPGEAPPVSHLIRYGFFGDDWPPVPVRVQEQGAALAATEHLCVGLDTATGLLTTPRAVTTCRKATSLASTIAAPFQRLW